jgi:cysteinyl-tRNA synthetase
MKIAIWIALLGLMLTQATAKDLQHNLSWVENWGYWLQNADIDTIAESPYDLMVIDYSRDGTDQTRYSRSDIAKLQAKGKLVLAYLSVGEAEDYRFYWKKGWHEGKPAFLGRENPDWPGNYKVKFWYKKWWKKVLRPYLDKILAAGYDGVYLDIIDAYWYWGTHGYKVRKMADKMVRLVSRINRYTARKSPDGFIVIAQNGLGIVDDASSKYAKRYFRSIDGVGVESLFYNYYSKEDQAYRKSLLKRFGKYGKKILNVEYIDEALYDDYWQKLDNSDPKVVGYAAEPDAELDELTHFDW